MGRSAIGSSPRAWGRFVLPGRRVSSSRFIPTCVGQIRSSAVCSCARSVHPHVRGADSWCWSGGMAPAGSSPRAWGRFLHRRVNGLARRFIPTCVGQMAAGRTPPPPGSVHPHVRGADAGRWNWKQRNFGSSPRAWGRYCNGCRKGYGTRFIPTCVGQISFATQVGKNTSVHPHVRGADQGYVVGKVPRHGSSPRAWGRCPRYSADVINMSVHPHVRGADYQGRAALSGSPGSSPRAWGRFIVSGRMIHEPRFIPTCVGQISSKGTVTVVFSVHPHVRGADEIIQAQPLPLGGSSPRAWGRCIGSGKSGPASAVHPHVRGADAAHRAAGWKTGGSSPRAWGRLIPSPSATWAMRFIPTCVGQMAMLFQKVTALAVHPHVRGADLKRRWKNE